MPDSVIWCRMVVNYDPYMQYDPQFLICIIGDTPMHDAVRLGRYRVVKSLILHGANLRVKNQIGKSPIDMVQLWYKDTKQTTTEARKKNSVAVKMTDLLNEHAELAAGQ